MRRRVLRALAMLGLLTALALGAASFLLAIRAESPGLQLADSAMALVGAACAKALSFLIWPGRA